MAGSGSGSGKIPIIVVILLILVVGGVAAGLSYFYSQRGVDATVQQKQIELNSLEEELGVKDLEIARLERVIETGPVVEPGGPAPGAQELDCLLCHDLEQHKEFHVPQTIMKIDEAHGKRRRVCVDCHGPNGPPWSADEQLTPLEMIDFDPTVGENGKFILSNQVVHSIHKRKLDAGILSCEFCHVPAGTTEFIKPEVKTELGRVLYCQNEGCHDTEGGNYIAIHVELRPFKCTTCHTGDLVKVHEGGTGRLGKFALLNGTSIHIH
jgi:hypothetical protein